MCESASVFIGAVAFGNEVFAEFDFEFVVIDFRFVGLLWDIATVAAIALAGIWRFSFLILFEVISLSEW